MLITREVDYALRILRTLSDSKLKSTSAICRQEIISQQFAYKILKKLSKSHFVSSTRGIDGGFLLTADLSQKTLYDLMVALGAAEVVNACFSPDFHCAWQQNCGQKCTIHTRLEIIQQAVDQQLQSYSLADLVLGGCAHSAVTSLFPNLD